MNFDPMTSCRSKVRYASEEFANAVIAKVHREKGLWLRLYPCDICGGYHLTKQYALPDDHWGPPKASRRAQAAMRKRDRERGKRRRGRQ